MLNRWNIKVIAGHLRINLYMNPTF